MYHTPGTDCCYLLRSTVVFRTYVGYTNHLGRRIRQHNGEIKGGAKSSRYGKPWEVVCYISGFATRRIALQFEKALHKCRKGGPGPTGRIKAIEHLLTMDRWFKTSPLTNTLDLTIHWLIEGLSFENQHANCKENRVCQEREDVLTKDAPTVPAGEATIEG